MGTGRMTADDWDNYQQVNNVSQKSTSQIFTAKTIQSDLNPLNVMRESVDSVDNPESTPIILAIDVTGSMGRLADVIVRTGLLTLSKEIYDRKPVSDPHILVAAIGDVWTDRYPLQVTQFEADIRIADQLTKIVLEGGGGGNGSESYALAWWFAAHKVKADSFKKRGKKGYLFTVGDDGPTPEFTKNQLVSVFGKDENQFSSMKDLLTLASREFEIFHILIAEGGTHSAEVERKWKDLLGERAIVLSDHQKLAEVIVSTIQVNEGSTVSSVANSWNGNTSLVVAKAISGLTVGKKSGTSGLVVL